MLIMFKYSKEQRDIALERAAEIGFEKASIEVGIPETTLRRWNREKNNSVKPADAQNTDPVIHGIEESLRQDLSDAKQLNRVTQETIDYLVEENRMLRQRCERYLKALALIVE